MLSNSHLDNGKLLLTYCWIRTELTRAVIPCLVCRPCKLQVENLSGQSWILRAEFLSIKFTSMASRVNLKEKWNWNITLVKVISNWTKLNQMVQIGFTYLANLYFRSDSVGHTGESELDLLHSFWFSLCWHNL